MLDAEALRKTSAAATPSAAAAAARRQRPTARQVLARERHFAHALAPALHVAQVDDRVVAPGGGARGARGGGRARARARSGTRERGLTIGDVRGRG